MKKLESFYNIIQQNNSKLGRQNKYYWTKCQMKLEVVP